MAMTVSPSLALYTWYHQHKKKDLGVGRKDWVQFLQGQGKENGRRNASTNSSSKTCEKIVNDECVKKESQIEEKTEDGIDRLKQEQQLDENCVDATSPHLVAKFQCSSHQKEEQDEVCSQSSSHSQKIEGAQQLSEETPAMPLSPLLNTTINSPMLLLPQAANNTSLEETHALPLYSPTLPLCEAFSPGKRGGSPRDTIMESLGGNLDGSEVSWSSALATPTNPLHGHTLDCTSPSTLERQTLHPRQRLRENVLARSLFSPRPYGAASSSPSGEVSPGLGIIKCFSPVPRFSCRDVRMSCPNESTKPGWLEAGTQGFPVSRSCEKRVSHGKKIVVTPEDQEGSSIKPFLEDGEHCHSPQINLSQDCVVVRPDQTSTPAQPRPVKARHLELSAQSPEPTSFIEPIPLDQGVKKDERDQVTNSGPCEKDVTEVDSCDDDKSDASEYSDDSAEHPFDIICSPVSKVKQRKKSNTSKSKSSLRTPVLKLNKEALPTKPINYADEKSKKEPAPLEALNCLSGKFISDGASQDTHSENINISKEKSLYKDGFPLNRGNSGPVEDTDPKVKLFSEDCTIDIACCQADTARQTEYSMKSCDLYSTTPPSGKHTVASVVTKKDINFSDNTSTNKQEIKVISSEDRKEYISEPSSKQKRKSIGIPSLYKKKKLTRGFVYPSDLDEGYKELNVSYTETIGGDERWHKTVAPASTWDTCITPNNKFSNEKPSEITVQEGKDATYILNSEINNEKWIEAVPENKGAVYSTHTNTVGDESQIKREVPDDKSTTCSISATPLKATEEMDISTVKQKKFLPLSNLENRDTSEMNSNPSCKLLDPNGCKEMADSFRIQTPVDMSESGENNRQHCTLRVVPVASVTPCEREFAKEIYSADSNKLQGNMSSRHSTPPGNVKMSSVRTECGLASIIHPVLSRKQEGQGLVTLSKPKVPEPKPVEDLATQGNRGQRKYVSSSLNNQLIGDTFSDIDFSDSDLDISLPLGERSATDNDENMKLDKDSDVYTRVASRKENLLGTELNCSNTKRDSAFLGFMTGSGKQVKVSDKALQQAKKLLEEETCEEQSLGPQQVPPGKSFSMDYSNMSLVKKEIRHWKSDLHMGRDSNNRFISEKGPLATPSNLSNDVSNEGTSKFEPKIKNMNTIPVVNASCTKVVVQSGFHKETSSESGNTAMRGIFFCDDDDASKGSDMQDSYDDCNGKTSDYNVTLSLQLKDENTGEGLQELGTTRDAEEKTSKILERAYVLCEENSSLNCNGEAKLMKDAKITCNRLPFEPKVSEFQGFSTAAGSRVKFSKEALRKAQMLWEEELDINLQTFLNKDINKQCSFSVLAKEQCVEMMSTIPVELKTTIGILKNEGKIIDNREKSQQCIDHGEKSQQCIPSKILEAETYSSNDCSSSNQEKCDLRKLSKSGLPSTMMDDGVYSSTHAAGDYHTSNLSKVLAQQVTKKETGKTGVSFPTLPTVNEPSTSKENLYKDIPNIENSSGLKMDVGFHTAKGRKVFVNETSIAQAQLLWKETDNSELLRPQQQQQSFSNQELLKQTEVGFHTAKGEKDSVNKASVTQAQLLSKEIAGSEVIVPGHEVTQEQHNDEISRKLIHSPDGTFLGCMKAIPKSHGLQINSRGSSLSSSLKLSAKEVVTEEKEFAASSSQGNLSDANMKISGRDTYGETNTKPHKRIANTFTAFNTGSSTASEGEVVQSVDLPIRPRRLFGGEMHSRSVMKSQPPTLVIQNNFDLKGSAEADFHKRKSDNGEGRVTYVSKTVQDSSRTASHALCTDPSHLGINQDMVCRLSEEDIRASKELHDNEKMKIDLQHNTETNVFFKTNKSENLLKGASQKMDIGLHTKSTNRCENMNQRENTILEGKNTNVSDPTVCGYLTGNTKQVRVSNKSLQQAKQLMQQCISTEGSPENTIRSSFGIEKTTSNTNKRQIATVEPFVVTVDQNSGSTDENHEVRCGSPILGSQKRSNRERIARNMFSLKNDSINIQEISDISDVTEAFMKDCLLDCEDPTKHSSSQRKRMRGLYQCKGEDSLTSHKKMRRNMGFSQSSNSQGYGVREETRTLAQEKQEKLMLQKENQVIQPIPGSLYKLRTERKQDRIKLQSLGRLKVYRKGRTKTLSVTYSNALHYRFKVQDSRCDSIECGDGCVVLLGTDGCVGIEEVELGFLAMPGVHPGLLPLSWTPNHFRLIVWQLAALERRLLDCQVLTVENVVARLKYRYDREIDRAERPILRKITEQDDVPQKTMVLCVTSVKLSQEVDGGEDKSRAVDTRLLPLLELTDGWYNIGAVVDKAMAQLIEDRRVEVGTKLVLHGSELVGATSPCHPLQASSTLRLRLHTNMTRRARWWAHLGLLPQSEPLPSLIEATHSDGGLVGQVKVMVARLYPMYYERSQNGLGLFMGEKAHLKKLRETEKQRELLVEQITAEVEKELHHQEVEENVKKGRRPMTPEEIRGLTLGQEISHLLDEAADPSSLEGLLTPHQMQLASTWRERHTEEMRRRLHTEVTDRLAKRQKPYEAVPLLKVRIVDGQRDGALVTVWRPSAELRENLSERSFFTIHYLMAAGYRWGSRQFVSTRQTRWEHCFRGPVLWQEEFARSATPLCLTTSRDLNPLWQEVDVAGVVLRVGKSTTNHQTVYLVDHHLNILAVNFWGGLKKCGYEDSIVNGTVVCLMNCSWRGYSGGIIGCIHFTEHSMATLSPSSPHLVEAAAHLRNSIKDMKSLLNEADKRLDDTLDCRPFPDKVWHCGEKTVEWKHVISLEDESLQADEENKGANSKIDRQEQQAKEVQNKLKLLSQYGSPGCSPGILSPASLRTRKPFRVPIRKPQNITALEADEHN